MQTIKYWFALVLLIIMGVGVLAGFVNLAVDGIGRVMGDERPTLPLVPASLALWPGFPHLPYVQGSAVPVNPDRYYEEPEATDYEALDAEQDTRAANDGDAHRKGEN